MNGNFFSNKKAGILNVETKYTDNPTLYILNLHTSLLNLSSQSYRFKYSTNITIELNGKQKDLF